MINFTFFETFKDEPIPHKNFTFLCQGSYEITGGSARPPLVSNVVPKPLVSEGLINLIEVRDGKDVDPEVVEPTHIEPNRGEENINMIENAEVDGNVGEGENNEKKTGKRKRRRRKH